MNTSRFSLILFYPLKKHTYLCKRRGYPQGHKKLDYGPNNTDCCNSNRIIRLYKIGLQSYNEMRTRGGKLHDDSNGKVLDEQGNKYFEEGPVGGS
jgi:hypothetical protein